MAKARYYKFWSQVYSFLLMYGLGLGLSYQSYNQLKRCEHIQSATQARWMEIEHLDQKGASLNVTAKILDSQCACLLKVKSMDLEVPLHIGDSIEVYSELKQPSPPSNPHEFNYQRWLLLQGIVWQSQISSTEIDSVKAVNFNFIDKASQINGQLQLVLKLIIPSPRSFALLSAILLGDKSAMEKSDQQVFSETGTMHVMAVSGLHVGLIATLIFSLLPKIPGKRGAWLRFAVLMIGIWGFVLISGAKPSAIRAGLMFSLFFMGRALDRNGHPLNALFVAMFAMCLFNPRIIYDLGFQFSVMAVMSILIYTRYITPFYKPESAFLNGLWQITSVSIAVQVLLAPLSIYYFHQFPVAFIPANLIALPLASILLIGGILTIFIFLFFPIVGKSMGIMMDGICQTGFELLTLLHQTSSWNLSDLWPETWQIAAILIGVFLVTNGIMNGTKRVFRYGLVIVVMVVAGSTFKQVQKQNVEALIVYDWPYSGLIDIKAGNSLFRIQSSDKIIQTGWQSFYGLGSKSLGQHHLDSTYIVKHEPNTILLLGTYYSSQHRKNENVVIANHAKTLVSYLCDATKYPELIVLNFQKLPNELKVLIEQNQEKTRWHHVDIEGSIEIPLNS